MATMLRLGCIAGLLVVGCGNDDPSVVSFEDAGVDLCFGDAGEDLSPQPCESWFIDYALEPMGFDIRQTPFGLGNKDNSVGPGRLRLRFSGDDSGPSDGKVTIVGYEYKLRFEVSGVETNLMVAAGPSLCGVTQGERRGSTVGWSTPTSGVHTMGTITCRASGFLCDVAGYPKDTPVVQDTRIDQPMQPFEFAGADDYSSFTMSEIEVPNEDPGDTFLRFSGREVARRCVALPAGC